MEIDFFCEYPEEGLDKAEMLDSDSVVYIAAENIEEYREYKQKLHEVNSDLDPAYWPILEESYWVSPFSTVEELENLKEELTSLDSGEKVLVDLELPLLNKKRFITGIKDFRFKRSLIKDILKLSHLDVRTAEYTGYPGTKKFLSLLGVNYSDFEIKRGVMYYTSLWNGFNLSLRRRSVKNFVNGESNFYIGVGTIGKGVFGDEQLLSEEDLRRDLNYLEKLGVDNVCVFRLGAVNREYLNILREFS